jgi:hypothetical protein
MTRQRWIIAAVLAGSAIACDAIFGETSQCSTNEDCAGLGGDLVCGDRGTCVSSGIANNGSTGDGGTAGNGTDATTASDAPTGGGVLAKILVNPETATVPTNGKQTFYATGLDALGAAPKDAPVFSWSVNGGGTFDGGVFTAGNSPGGPFIVTCTSGAVSATAQVTVSNAPPVDIKVGETNMLANDDSMNSNKLLAQEVTLADTATLKSLSFYVKTAAGKLKLGVYDSGGPNGGPGAKLAETAEFDAIAGWGAQNVMQTKVLQPGKYWLAYAPNDDGLVFLLSDADDGKLAFFDRAYDATLPDTFSDAPTTDTKHWSFYMTLTK